jgi:hypothetical protein
VYERISVADVGAKYQVVGKNSSNNYWIILLPDGRQCWLWGQYAVLEGNINLPEFVPPVPPPVPTEVPLPVVGSIIVTVQAPLMNGQNDAAISSATVSIDGFGTVPVYLGGGQYQFSSIPFGQYKVRVKASTSYDAWSSDFITVSDVYVPSKVLVRLEWTLRILRGCSQLATIQARLKCYNQVMNVQTLVPPQLP